jgi:hypothetical protein
MGRECLDLHSPSPAAKTRSITSTPGGLRYTKQNGMMNHRISSEIQPMLAPINNKRVEWQKNCIRYYHRLNRMAYFFALPCLA